MQYEAILINKKMLDYEQRKKDCGSQCVMYNHDRKEYPSAASGGVKQNAI